MLRMEGVFARADGDAPVLRGAELAIAAGNARLIFGESCVGKTTVLRLLAGLEHPSEGVVEVMGRDLARLRADSLRRLRRRIALVTESPLFIEDATAFDNVVLPLEIAAERVAMRRRRAAAALAEVGLDGALEIPARRLSRSQRRRLAFARALVARPVALLLDEPERDLDETGREALCNLVDRLAAAGAACVITSGDHHMLELAELWGWGVSELRDGALTAYHEVVYRDRMGQLLDFPAAARAGGGR